MDKKPFDPALVAAYVDTAIETGGNVAETLAALFKTMETSDEAKARIGKKQPVSHASKEKEF
jgi:hypothetical protein